MRLRQSPIAGNPSRSYAPETRHTPGPLDAEEEELGGGLVDGLSGRREEGVVEEVQRLTARRRRNFFLPRALLDFVLSSSSCPVGESLSLGLIVGGGEGSEKMLRRSEEPRCGKGMVEEWTRRVESQAGTVGLEWGTTKDSTSGPTSRISNV